MAQHGYMYTYKENTKTVIKAYRNIPPPATDSHEMVAKVE